MGVVPWKEKYPIKLLVKCDYFNKVPVSHKIISKV